VLARAKGSSNIKKIFDHRGHREAQGKQILVVVGRFMFSLWSPVILRVPCG